MHLYLEQLQKPSSYCDCNLHSLSWMGRVPSVEHLMQNWDQSDAADSQDEEETWRLNRVNYYEEGWLASGNQRGMVGVTFTSCKPPPPSTFQSSAPEPDPLNLWEKLDLNDPARMPEYSPSLDLAHDRSLPARCNYNLRGHRSEVILVKWNEPYQKLATVDSSGVIFVWTKYEGRWSIELINDRSTQVVDFAWSHDGRLALICYVDGFVLIGSVAGQRYWSSALSLNGAKLSCGVWTPDDRLVLVGLSNGCLLVINLTGALVGQYQLREQSGIQHLSWSCGKFRLDEEQDLQPPGSAGLPPGVAMVGARFINLNFFGETRYPSEGSDTQTEINSDTENNSPIRSAFCERKESVGSEQSSTFENDANHILCVCFEDGELFLLKDYDDPQPRKIRTHLLSLRIDWSENGQVLAVGGHRMFPHKQGDETFYANSANHHSSEQQKARQAGQPYYENMLHFYCGRTGRLKYRLQLPYYRAPVTALTWAHNDKRLFVATGHVLHVAWVTKHVPSLQLLSRLAVKRSVRLEPDLIRLGLPEPMRLLVSSLFSRTMRCPLPSADNLRRFVFFPPPGHRRLHCTLIRHASNVVNSHVDRGRGSSNMVTSSSNGGGGSSFVLYLEYLGGLVPILKGKRTSQFKPEFVIFEPIYREEPKKRRNYQNTNEFTSPLQSLAIGERLLKQMRRSRLTTHRNDNQVDFLADQFKRMTNGRRMNLHRFYWTSDQICLYNQSNNNQSSTSEQSFNGWLWQTLKRSAARANSSNATQSPQNSTSNRNLAGCGNGSLDYPDEMPEQVRILEVNANVWGTKFKMISLVSWLPAEMGSISYRTSLLHLQPRQMNLRIKDLSSANAPQEEHFVNENVVDVTRLYRDKITNNVPITPIVVNRLQSLQSNSGFSSPAHVLPPPPPPPSQPAPDIVWGYSVLDDYRAAAVAPITPRFVRRQIPGFCSSLASPESNGEVFRNPNHEIDSRDTTESRPYSMYEEEMLTLQILQDLNGRDFNLQLRPEEKVPQSTISTQTSFPSLIEIQTSTRALDELSIDTKDGDGLHVMDSMTNSLEMVHERPAFLRTLPPGSGGGGGSGINGNRRRHQKFLNNMPAQRHSMDFSLCRRLTLKNDRFLNRTPVSSAKSQLQRRLRNRMYLDEEYDDEECDDMEDDMKNSVKNSLANDSSIWNESKRSQTFCGSVQVASTTVHHLHNQRKGPPGIVAEESESTSYLELKPSCLNKENATKNAEILKSPSTKSICSIASNNGLEKNNLTSQFWQPPNTPVHQRRLHSSDVNNNSNNRNRVLWPNNRQNSQDSMIERLSTDLPSSSNQTNRSLPASPLNHIRRNGRKKSFSRSLFYSPVLLRRAVKKKLQYLDCSSDDDHESDREIDYGDSYFNPLNQLNQYEENSAKSPRNRSFRRNWLNLKRPTASSRVQPNSEFVTTVHLEMEPEAPELVLHNKSPVWNEISQVYQLDFGGRVTQESAKNFQIEHQQKQVLQFGRIDSHTYTLDFQHPFSALQALAVALANVTQRLK